MSITVSITTCNRPDSLAGALAALAAQDFAADAFEVIVADNGMPGKTRQVCDDLAHHFQNFRYVADDRPGQLVGWHRSLALAQGEVTCFIDDDVAPAPTWLAALADAYADSAVGMVTGPIRARYAQAPPPWVDEMTLGEPGAETLPPLGLLEFGDQVRDIPGNFVWGTNFTIRRQLLMDVGGFHPGAMPGHLLYFYGDAEIEVGRAVEAAGQKILYHPDAAVEHVIPAARFETASLRAKLFTAGCARSYQFLRQTRESYSMPSEEEFRAMAERYLRRGALAPAELRDTIQTGLHAGMATHLQHFTDDPAFRDWVLWADYRDLDGCYVHPDLQPQRGAATPDWRAGMDGGC